VDVSDWKFAMSKRKRTPRKIREKERMVGTTAVAFGYYGGVTPPQKSAVTPEVLEASGRLEEDLHEHELLQEQKHIPAEKPTG
jgi:hypothetical protein